MGLNNWKCIYVDVAPHSIKKTVYYVQLFAYSSTSNQYRLELDDTVVAQNVYSSVIRFLQRKQKHMPLSCWGASLARKWSWCFHGIVVVHGVCGRVARARISCFRASCGVSRHRYWPNMAYMPHPAGFKDCACFLHSWMEQTRSLTPVLSFYWSLPVSHVFFGCPFEWEHMRIKSVDSRNHVTQQHACRIFTDRMHLPIQLLEYVVIFSQPIDYLTKFYHWLWGTAELHRTFPAERGAHGCASQLVLFDIHGKNPVPNENNYHKKSNQMYSLYSIYIYICMYVCMHVCMYIRIYICIII